MDNNIIEEIVRTAHHIYDKEMILGKAGNISILDDNREHMYITASGTDFKSLVHGSFLVNGLVESAVHFGSFCSHIYITLGHCFI